jgi:Family of unknown function (DUF5995)
MSSPIDAVYARLLEIETQLDGYYSPQGGGPAERRRHPPLPDGVACFNGLYLQVTDAVRAGETDAFLVRLDVVFAGLYFAAFEAAAAGRPVSKAWEPLFEQKDRPHILPLQFAIAGMNAHINNDLALALVQVWRELGIDPRPGCPQEIVYKSVNATLTSVEQAAKVPLATAFITDLDRATDHLDDWFALWNVAKARQDAWDRALELHAHPSERWPVLWDRAVGFLSHLLLAPVLV